MHTWPFRVHFQCLNRRDELDRSSSRSDLDTSIAETNATVQIVVCVQSGIGMRMCTIYCAGMLYARDYVSLGNAWSLTSHTCSGERLAAFKGFAGYTWKFFHVLFLTIISWINYPQNLITTERWIATGDIVLCNVSLETFAGERFCKVQLPYYFLNHSPQLLSFFTLLATIWGRGLFEGGVNKF